MAWYNEVYRTRSELKRLTQLVKEQEAEICRIKSSPCLFETETVNQCNNGT